jgi:hypothetical protein
VSAPKDHLRGHLGISLFEGDLLDIHLGLIRIIITKIKGKRAYAVIEAPREIKVARVPARKVQETLGTPTQ